MTNNGDKAMGENSSPAWTKELRETIVVVAQAFLIFLVIRSFLFQQFYIPSASLQPTVLIGDYIATSKYTYGYSKYSFPFQFIPMRGRIFGRAPVAGEIAVFRPVPQRVDYVKRVIGIPGDEIRVTNGLLYINDVAVKKEKIGKAIDTDGRGVSVEMTQYRETLPNGTSYIVNEISDNSQFDNTGVFKVPDGHYFMMGDNRDRSLDSRALSVVGYVPLENFIAKAEFRFLSMKDNVPPWQIWRWPDSLRLDRMFQSVYQ